MVNQQRRDAAFHAIETERDYQDAQLGNSEHHSQREVEIATLVAKQGNALSLGEGILCMEKLLDDTRKHWYSPEGFEEALHHVRKIAGVATQLLENFGAPPRLLPITGTMSATDEGDVSYHNVRSVPRWDETH